MHTCTHKHTHTHTHFHPPHTQTHSLLHVLPSFQQMNLEHLSSTCFPFTGCRGKSSWTWFGFDVPTTCPHISLFAHIRKHHRIFMLHNLPDFLIHDCYLEHLPPALMPFLAVLKPMSICRSSRTWVHATVSRNYTIINNRKSHRNTILLIFLISKGTHND